MKHTLHDKSAAKQHLVTSSFFSLFMHLLFRSEQALSRRNVSLLPFINPNLSIFRFPYSEHEWPPVIIL